MTHAHLLIESTSNTPSIKPPHRLWVIWDLSAGVVLGIRETAADAREAAESYHRKTGDIIAIVFARLFYDPDKVVGDPEPRF